MAGRPWTRSAESSLREDGSIWDRPDGYANACPGRLFGHESSLRANGMDADRFLALTANAMHGDRQRCLLEAGCDDFATKPIHRVELIEQIRVADGHGAAESWAGKGGPGRTRR